MSVAIAKIELQHEGCAAYEGKSYGVITTCGTVFWRTSAGASSKASILKCGTCGEELPLKIDLTEVKRLLKSYLKRFKAARQS